MGKSHGWVAAALRCCVIGRVTWTLSKLQIQVHCVQWWWLSTVMKQCQDVLRDWSMIRDRKGFMISLDKELDRINKTMLVVDKIYSDISLSYCITSSKANRQGS